MLDELETAGRGRTTRELTSVVNLGMGRLEAMLKILDVEGAVMRVGNRWHPVSDSDWNYDADRYKQVTALRRAEQAAMAAYGTDGRCLMRPLQEELDDPDPKDCGRCSVCTEPRFNQPPATRLVERAQRHLRSRPIELEVRKMEPDARGTMRKIPESARTEPGWALARVGDGGWWPAIQRGLDAGHSTTRSWPPSPTFCGTRVRGSPGSRVSRPCDWGISAPAWPSVSPETSESRLSI